VSAFPNAQVCKNAQGAHYSFFGLFSTFIYKLVNNAEAVRMATEQTLKDFEDDGVVHFEIRTTPRAFEQTSKPPFLLVCRLFFNLLPPI
jgi:hypothetical protein